MIRHSVNKRNSLLVSSIFSIFLWISWSATPRAACDFPSRTRKIFCIYVNEVYMWNKSVKEREIGRKPREMNDRVTGNEWNLGRRKTCSRIKWDYLQYNTIIIIIIFVVRQISLAKGAGVRQQKERCRVGDGRTFSVGHTWQYLLNPSFTKLRVFCFIPKEKKYFNDMHTLFLTIGPLFQIFCPKFKRAGQKRENSKIRKMCILCVFEVKIYQIYISLWSPEYTAISLSCECVWSVNLSPVSNVFFSSAQ